MNATTETTETDSEERRLLERLKANHEAAKKALKAATTEPTVEGSTGQRRANPLFDIAARCDELALRLSQELRELQKRRDQDAELERLRDLATDQPRLR